MGLQDDIFDIDAALEGTPLHERFESLIHYMGRLEYALQTLQEKAVIYVEDQDGYLRRWEFSMEDQPTILDSERRTQAAPPEPPDDGEVIED
jgi:hypothetical protein